MQNDPDAYAERAGHPGLIGPKSPTAEHRNVAICDGQPPVAEDRATHLIRVEMLSRASRSRSPAAICGQANAARSATARRAAPAVVRQLAHATRRWVLTPKFKRMMSMAPGGGGGFIGVRAMPGLAGCGLYSRRTRRHRRWPAAAPTDKDQADRAGSGPTCCGRSSVQPVAARAVAERRVVAR